MKEIKCDNGDVFKVMPAFCIDLDGTIRRSKTGGFIQGPDDIELFPGIEEKLWQIRDEGYLIIGVSNQGGVAFGHKIVEVVDEELESTIALFSKGNPFHMVFHSYHMEGGTVEPYCYRSMCGKPDIGMLAMAEQEAFECGYIIDWDKSVMCGDRDEDRQLADNAKISFIEAIDFQTKDSMDDVTVHTSLPLE